MVTFAEKRPIGETLTLNEAAKQLGVHITTMRRYVEKNNIQTYRKPGDQKLYVAKDIIEVLMLMPNVRNGDR